MLGDGGDLRVERRQHPIVCDGRAAVGKPNDDARAPDRHTMNGDNPLRRGAGAQGRAMGAGHAD